VSTTKGSLWKPARSGDIQVLRLKLTLPLSYVESHELKCKLTPEEKARETIDGMLKVAGWLIQNRTDANIDAGPGRSDSLHGLDIDLFFHSFFE